MENQFENINHGTSHLPFLRDYRLIGATEAPIACTNKQQVCTSIAISCLGLHSSLGKKRTVQRETSIEVVQGFGFWVHKKSPLH